ncbi:MAG: type II secretion system F family protein [Deltaproteobacteria bacterium]|nr:type II secretion system F family protein [Deltaproteobacteria bacterium]
MSFLTFQIIISLLTGTEVLLLIILTFSNFKNVSIPKGSRGASYNEAIKSIPNFKYMYLAIRAISLHIDPLIPIRFKSNFNIKLKRANYPFGFDSSDIISISFIIAAVLSLSSGFLTHIGFGYSMPGIIFGFITGLIIPIIKVNDGAASRIKTILRTMPPSIEMIALSLRAGMDFLGAMENVASRMKKDNPLKFEFNYMINRMSLGSSRNEVLKDFALKMEAADITRFVSSVILAEKKGSPLSEILEIQSNIMRLKRSQAAEAAATKASLLMFIPLMLIFFSVFLLFLGPFIVKMSAGTLV